MAEPMITIKKPDGTFSKVSLSEFKKMQTEKKQSHMQKGESVVSPAAASVMKKTTVHIKSDSSQFAVQTKKLNRDDARSPLEERIMPKSMAPFTSVKREKQVDEVVQKIGFSVSPDLQGRLKSLVLARLKDIKTEDDIKETLSRPVKSGGLGLENKQVDAVIRCCREVLSAEITMSKTAEVPVLKGKSNGMALMVEPPELPMVIPVSDTIKTKTNTPASAAALPVEVQKPAKNDIVSKLINESIANEAVFKIGSQPLKQTMHDVSAPAEIEMGPVEEFKSVTVEEFRRLSSNPIEAAKRLHQKMSNLQDESFVWYLDGIHAYHQSPLYKEYMAAVAQSLAERKTLANVLNVKNGIKLTEVMALIEMEEEL